MIKLKIAVGQGKHTEGKETKRGHKNQRVTHSLSWGSHKSTKPAAIIHTQRTWYKPGTNPRRPCACCFRLHELICNALCSVDLEGLAHAVSSLPPGGMSSSNPSPQGSGKIRER